MIDAAVYGRLATAALISMCAFPATASAQQVMAHMEACLEWGDIGGQFGAVNICNKPTTILVMVLADGRVIEQHVPAGGRFLLGAAEPDGANSWMFTACPVGYAPSVRFTADNADVIMPSLYNCLHDRPGA